MKCVGQFFIKTFDLGAGGGAELWITLYNKLFSCNYDIVNKNLRYSYIYCFCFVLIIHLSGLLQNLSLSQCVLMIQEKMVFKSKRSSQRQDLLLKASKCGSTNLPPPHWVTKIILTWPFRMNRIGSLELAFRPVSLRNRVCASNPFSKCAIVLSSTLFPFRFKQFL